MKQVADICLLLEGTYPFVRGGVSAWLHQLVLNLSEHTFALVFLGGRRGDYDAPRYALPPNVVHLETHYLEDALKRHPPQRAVLPPSQLRELRALHEALRAEAAAAAAESPVGARGRSSHWGAQHSLRDPCATSGAHEAPEPSSFSGKFRVAHHCEVASAHPSAEALDESSWSGARPSHRDANATGGVREGARTWSSLFRRFRVARECEAASGHAPADALERGLRSLAVGSGVQLSQFLYSLGSWELICSEYATRSRQVSFLDYFWTLRLLHAPLFQLAAITADVPYARAYHCISTGYAGFLGALLALRRSRPLILSEHGIYTKERRIDLNQSEWLDSKQGAGDAGGSSELRELWIRYFESLGRITYHAANPIIALSAGNQQRQIADGAPAARTRVIANGIDVAKLAPALWARSAEVPQVIGLLGRVVPIKDVKTFVRAVGVVVASLPRVRAQVIGGADEDPEYARECEALVSALHLGDHVTFVGHRVPAEVFPKLGVLMLTSISEGQPLAILEAFAAGLPCIATDVGACRELIEGRDEADRALGAAGRVVPFADVTGLAEAAVELLTQPDVWQACQSAGLKRVRTYYDERFMLNEYRDLYRSALGQ